MFFQDDPLWDGDGYDGVEKENGCCDFPGLPWFFRNLTTATDNSIEL